MVILRYSAGGFRAIVNDIQVWCSELASFLMGEPTRSECIAVLDNYSHLLRHSKCVVRYSSRSGELEHDDLRQLLSLDRLPRLLLDCLLKHHDASDDETLELLGVDVLFDFFDFELPEIVGYKRCTDHNRKEFQEKLVKLFCMTNKQTFARRLCMFLTSYLDGLADRRPMQRLLCGACSPKNPLIIEKITHGCTLGLLHYPSTLYFTPLINEWYLRQTFASCVYYANCWALLTPSGHIVEAQWCDDRLTQMIGPWVMASVQGLVPLVGVERCLGAGMGRMFSAVTAAIVACPHLQSRFLEAFVEALFSLFSDFNARPENFDFFCALLLPGDIEKALDFHQRHATGVPLRPLLRHLRLARSVPPLSQLDAPVFPIPDGMSEVFRSLSPAGLRREPTVSAWRLLVRNEHRIPLQPKLRQVVARLRSLAGTIAYFDSLG